MTPEINLFSHTADALVQLTALRTVIIGSWHSVVERTRSA